MVVNSLFLFFFTNYGGLVWYELNIVGPWAGRAFTGILIYIVIGGTYYLTLSENRFGPGFTH